MEHPVNSEDSVDLNELRKVFVDRIISASFEGKLLGSEKLRRALLELTTQDEIDRFIRNSLMSARLRSQLLTEAAVISENKSSTSNYIKTNQSSQSSEQSAKLPERTVSSTCVSLAPSAALSMDNHKTKVQDSIANNKRMEMDSTPTAPTKRVFTAKRTFPQRSVSSTLNPTPKAPETVGNKPLFPSIPLIPLTAKVASDVPRTPSGSPLLHDASKKGEGDKKFLGHTFQHDRLLAVASILERAPQQLEYSPIFGLRISEEREKEQKRKRDDSNQIGSFLDLHSPKSRRLNSVNTSFELQDATSTKADSENELPAANYERSASREPQQLPSNSIVELPESTRSHTEESTLNSFDINPNNSISTGLHTSGDTDEICDDKTDDDIPLRRILRSDKVSKPNWNYKIWTFPSGETQPTSGALLPRGYNLRDDPDTQWICPIRSCRVLFSRLESLGRHFNRVHKGTLLNDNNDGTLSVIKKVEASGVFMPAEVVSHKRSDPNEPLKEPSLSCALRRSKVATSSSSPVGDLKNGPAKTHKSDLTPSTCGPLDTEALVEKDGIEGADVQNLLKHMVRSRDIVWNNAFRTQFRETNDNDISALILQVTGQKAEIPCDKCTEGKGPFEECIVMPLNAPLDFAFSNSYLARSQAVRIGREVSFQAVTIKPGMVHYWSASANKLRLCSIASGKLQMSIHGQEFSIGLNGMIRIRPGVECTAINKLYIDATVHVTVVPGDLCG
ncbi:hypothetical protein Daesc_009850 [Daldinia eschscholtzii]|uniref:C2H2-type domain-containing protein n=1 Tax=Daldinia eschscholtzii TaxID=292717 RepID=A0AAX6M6R6_9PEZI